MSNPSRRIGTDGENSFLGVLRHLFGDTVERAPLKGINDHGDFVGVPWLFESKAKGAKSQTRPRFLQWAVGARHKCVNDPHPHRWVVRWKGDLRKHEGPYWLISEEFGIELVQAWLNDETGGFH